MTYECRICWTVNHSSRLHCQCCGTIPAQYSPIAGVLLNEHKDLETDYYVQILVAFGCERQTSRRTIKRTLRTVPLDYYASSEVE